MEVVAKAESLQSAESSARMPYGPVSPVRSLPYTPLYSLNSLNSITPFLAWDDKDKHGLSDRDRTPDATRLLGL